MDPRIIAIMGTLTVITTINILFLYFRKDQKVINYQEIIGLFDKQTISTIDFIRNKIVVSFNDVKSFDVNQLKDLGGKGINIIGDKVKFFVSDDNKENKMVYEDLIHKIGG